MRRACGLPGVQPASNTATLSVSLTLLLKSISLKKDKSPQSQPPTYRLSEPGQSESWFLKLGMTLSREGGGSTLTAPEKGP